MDRRLLVALTLSLPLASAAGCASLLGDFTTDDRALTDGGADDSSRDAAVDSTRDGAPDAVPPDGDADGSPAANPHAVVQISAGGGTACARTADGLLYCWGENGVGQVGDGTQENRLLAVRVARDSTGAPFANIVEMDVGKVHVCARDRYRYFYCWGDDDFAQLGDGRYNADGGGIGQSDSGAFLGNVRSTTPLKNNMRGTAPVQIAVGGLHSCLVDDPLLDAGLNLSCWGSNAAGELGHDVGTNGDVTPKAGLSFPVGPNPSGDQNAARDLTQVSLGPFTGCYLRPGGTVWCWGSDPSTNGSSPVPAEVPGPGNVGVLANMLEVSARSSLHACARDTTPSGNVWCWGINNSGELGTGAPIGTGARSHAVQVTVSSVRQIVVADGNSCVVVGAQGDAVCWGSNAHGQLGHENLGDRDCTGNGTPCDPTPQRVGTLGDAGEPLRGVAELAMGTDFVCARKADGTVWCWGSGARGQLGDGQGKDSFVPVEVRGLP
jgi:alpha-tubulin suppressor-like RCC1 family protein